VAAAITATACTSAGTIQQIAELPMANLPIIPPVEAPQVARVAPQPRSSTAARFPFEIQTEWLPTKTNYYEGRGDASVDYIVIHYTAISYARTLKAFNILASDVSAHYVVRGDGHVAQVVGEADTAWHSGNAWFNDHSVGIEIELDDNTNPEFTAAQYYATAALACAIAARHGIPLDRAHVVGHNEVPGSTHSDPGPTWGWPHFMWLTSLCAPPTAANVRASFVTETPYPAIAAGETASVSVVLRNDGATAWRKGTAQEARLALPGNDTSAAFLGKGWPAPDRPAVQTEDIVPPGGTATFTFAVGAAIPGTYRLPLRGVIDGASWMNDLGLYTEITVH
jgi:N-acetyl-anhydromuramyl-L-alanine amidase AmpD